MVKVPSDPAQVIVNHASFRVQLGGATRTPSSRVARHLSADDAARIPVVGTAGRAGGPAARGPPAAHPSVWSGRSDPDDTGAHRLLQAVRSTGVRPRVADPTGDAGATQVIPRLDEHQGYAGDLTVHTAETPLVGSQRGHDHDSAGTRLLPNMRSVDSAYDEPRYTGGQFTAEDPDGGCSAAARRPGERLGPGPARLLPRRRMNLGVVLLPLRVFLGFISIYAGMGKLCDPVYFDGGKRGSMVKWLNTLHPWDVAEPLRQFALQHPVGSGLVIAFLQVIVGVLTVLGLWQRVAAVVGAMLSAALIVTVS